MGLSLAGMVRGWGRVERVPVCACGEPVRNGIRSGYCAKCHAEYMIRWRAKRRADWLESQAIVKRLGVLIARYRSEKR